MLPASFSSTTTHGKGHDSVLDVHAVFSLVIDDRLRAVYDGIRDLDAAVGGQAVHVDGILFGQGHTALVTNPASDPNIESERQISVEFRATARKTVNDGLRQFTAILRENFYKALMSVALMTAAPVSGVTGIMTFGWLVIPRVSVEERALREAAR